MKKIGLIINPIAGMGGRVGLKGTDSKEILQKAIQLGAVPTSSNRAALTLQYIFKNGPAVEWITCPGDMGEVLFKDWGFFYQLTSSRLISPSTEEDTITAARQMVLKNVDFILFVGGDGTARNIFDAIGEKPKVLGIPGGVKIHSPVFAQSPTKAGELCVQYLNSQIKEFHLTEVLDLDEQEIRKGVVNTKLYGYLNCPLAPRWLQNKKSSSPGSDKSIQLRIAKRIVEEMENDIQYLIGPGSTTAMIMQHLNLKNTLLGVDLIKNNQLVENDLNEHTILTHVQNRPSKFILTPTGGQGYLLGRGNQQISPDILNQINIDNIIIIATINKLSSIPSNALLVDTGDQELDKKISGYRRIITDDISTTIYKITY
jgi:predicted polyphosphate/ATP-dependent NAD kinase